MARVVNLVIPSILIHLVTLMMMMVLAHMLPRRVRLGGGWQWGKLRARGRHPIASGTSSINSLTFQYPNPSYAQP